MDYKIGLELRNGVNRRFGFHIIMTDSTENDVQPSAESENLEVISDKDKFYIELRKFYDNRVDGTTKPEWTKERVNAVINSIEQFNTASVLKQPKTQQQYRNAKKYDVMSVGEEKLLILRRKDLNSPVVQVPSTDMYYDILLQAHISTGHGGRDKLIYNLKQQYVIPVPIMILFLNLCKICLNKKSCPKTGIVVRPIISQDFNKRGQVDLIDLQSTPSHNYKWILNYQDHLTKFCFLRPLTSKKATEVAMALLKIFLEVGAPMILQSDNGKEFTASIIKELITLWPACKIVNGRPRHPQSQGLFASFALSRLPLCIFLSPKGCLVEIATLAIRPPMLYCLLLLSVVLYFFYVQ